MKNKAKYFYNDAKSYYLAAETLMMSPEREKDGQLLLMPILFLFRHALELLLKYHIIVFLTEHGQKDMQNYKLHNHKGIQQKQKLLGTHSIKNLFSCFIYWNKMSLCPKFDEKHIKFIRAQIKHLCSLDENSDYFRYPTGKNNKFHKRHYITRIDEFDVAPEINSKMEVLISDDNKTIFTTYSFDILYMQNELSECIQLLL